MLRNTQRRLVRFTLLSTQIRNSFSLEKSKFLHDTYQETLQPQTSFFGMRIVFLGTASNRPTLSRHTQCIALQLEKQVYLFDCGDGAQWQLLRSNLNSSSVNKIFITHMHGDHTSGLLSMIHHLRPGPGDDAPIKKSTLLNESEKAVEIYGPTGLTNFLVSALRSSYCGHALRQIHIVELGKNMREESRGIYHLFSDENVTVKAGRILHSVPCYGYVIEEHYIPGRIDAEKCKALGLEPGPDYKLLKQGFDVTLPDGRIIKSADVVSPPRKGRKIVILGDTSNPYNIKDIAMDADVLIHEATVPNELEEIAIYRKHSTPRMAGAFAKAINAKNLIITHFGGRYSDDYDFVETTMVKQAQDAFGSSRVFAASDFAVVDIPLPPKEVIFTPSPIIQQKFSTTNNEAIE